MSSFPDSNVDLSIRPGDTLDGRYKIQRLVAIGGMGAVFEALHVELQQQVAVKAMLREHTASPEATHRFIQEARAAAKLRSVHVAHVFDVGRLPRGEPYIVMEFLAGKDLRGVLAERGRLSMHLAVDWIIQSCDAMAEAHLVGIIHRDLKLGNIFVAERKRLGPIVKVLDFGISKITRTPDQLAMTCAGDVMGSPGYMAPEQLRDAKTVDARCDVWALGVILYELLTGKPAYEGATLQLLALQTVSESPKPIRSVRPDIPAELEAFILYGPMQRDLARRTPSIVELVRGLRPFASAQGCIQADNIIALYQDAVPSVRLDPQQHLAPYPVHHPEPTHNDRAPTERSSIPVEKMEESSGVRAADAREDTPVPTTVYDSSSPQNAAHTQVLDCDGAAEHELLTATPYAFKGLIAVHRLGELVAARAPDGRDLIVRVVHPRLDASQLNLERMVGVANTLAALCHPNVGTIHGVGRSGAGRLYIAWQADGGQTLLHGPANGRVLSFAEAVDHARQILAALQAAQNVGLCHGALSPGSVIMSVPVPGQFAAKVIDFSLDTSVPPEQVASLDVVGTARVLVALLTGREAPPDGDVVAAVRAAGVEVPSDLLQILCDAIKLGAVRYRSIRDLDQALAAINLRVYASMSLAPAATRPMTSGAPLSAALPMRDEVPKATSSTAAVSRTSSIAAPTVVSWWMVFVMSFAFGSGTALWLLNHLFN